MATRILSGAGFLLKAEKFAEFYKGLLDRSAKGKKPTESERKQMSKLAAELSKTYSNGEKGVRPVEELPLTFLLKIMNDSQMDIDMRLRAASICIPYLHVRKGETTGKKQEAAYKAKQAGSGKFSAGRPPQLKVIMK